MNAATRFAGGPLLWAIAGAVFLGLVSHGHVRDWLLEELVGPPSCEDPLTPPPPSNPPERPNLVLLIADDQREDTWPWMPCTAAFFDDPARGAYWRAVVSDPACCPSRAAMFTGLYGSRTGVLHNDDPLTHDTVWNVLHASGYETAITGKWLNSWNGRPRPEFDHWIVHAGGAVDYTRPTVNHDGRWTTLNDRSTPAFTVAGLDNALHATEPWALVIAYNAPHAPALPPRDLNHRYSMLPHHDPPSYRDDAGVDWVQEFRRDQLRVLFELDTAIAGFLQRLLEAGLLERTAIVYVSDNGFFWGEHGLTGKGLPYEEAVRVPLALWTPWPSEAEPRLAANIDIAPTLLDLANIESPWTMDGSSLLQTDPTHSVILESPTWHGVHTGNAVCIDWGNGHIEAFDLAQDPYQVRPTPVSTCSGES